MHEFKLKHCDEYPVDHLFDALERYLNYGILPGSFLTACLQNNLSNALGRADHQNREMLFEIVAYIYNYLPSASWGSAVKVTDWCEAVHNARKRESVQEDS